MATTMTTNELAPVSEDAATNGPGSCAAAAAPAKKTRRARKNSIVKDRRAFRASVYGGGEAAIDGFLGKKASSGRGAYKQRYFKASGHYLKYWDKREHSADPPKGTIDLNAAVSITQGGSKNDKIFIEIVSQEHGAALVKLQAKGPPEAQLWVAALLPLAPAAQKHAAAVVAGEADNVEEGEQGADGTASAAGATTRPRDVLAAELRQHVSDLLMSSESATAIATGSAEGGDALAPLEGDALTAPVSVRDVELAAQATVEAARALLANMQPSVRAALGQVDDGMLAALRQCQAEGGHDGNGSCPSTCGELVEWLVAHGMAEVMLMWLLSLAETKGHQLEQQRIAASVGPLNL